MSSSTPGASPRSAFLLGLDAFPVHEDLVGARHRHVAEHVWVAPDQLSDDAVGHVVDVPPSLVGGHLRVEHDLQQQVAELVAEAFVVAPVDRVEDLVGLLEQVPGQRAVVLFRVPRTPAGPPKPGHHPDEVEQPLAALGRREPAPRERPPGRSRPGGARGGQRGRGGVERNDLPGGRVEPSVSGVHRHAGDLVEEPLRGRPGRPAPAATGSARSRTAPSSPRSAG